MALPFFAAPRRESAIAALAAALGLLVAPACATRPQMITKVVDGRVITTRSISPRAYEHAARAFVYEEEERWEEAAAEYRRAIEYDRRSPELWAQLAEVMLELERPQDAQKAVDESLAVEVTVPGVVAAAHLYLHRGDAKAAARVLGDALARPQWADDAEAFEEVSLECADALIMALDLGGASRRLETLLATQPASQAGLYRQAAVAWSLSDFSQSRRYFERLIEIEPDHLEARLLLARLLTVMDKPKDARTAYADALARSEGDLTIAALYASFLMAHGLEDEAHALADDLHVADMDPSTLSLHMELERSAGRPKRALELADAAVDNSSDKETRARVLFAKAAQLEAAHRHDEAVQTFLQVPQDESNFTEARLRAVALLREHGKVPEAQALLDTVSKAELDEAMEMELTFARALLLGSRGEADKARQMLSQVRGAAGQTDRLHLAIATLEDKYGERQRALEAASKVLAHDPGSVEALNFWAFVAAEANQSLALALKRSQAALALDPGSPAIMDTIGWLHLKMGKPSVAQPFLEGAARIAPEEPEILAHVANLHARQGNKELAAARARQALLLDPSNELRGQLESLLTQLSGGAAGQTAAPPLHDEASTSKDPLKKTRAP